MASISSALFYILVFLSVYVQVFFLITFLENRKKIVRRNSQIKLGKYPSVTVIVPCWNEEQTVYRTVCSLLGLRYPKDKLKIFLIDDGSTDSTWERISRFSGRKNVQIFRKENGGKYTALNYGILRSDTEFVGCLDADSVADPEALARIMSYFEKDPGVMAVTPSILSGDSRSLVQKAQKAEYNMSVFVKKVQSFLGAIHVTPGPLTIFRRKVFDDLGLYRHAHTTEDMEIAYRMQRHRYRIEQCNDAYVYTNTPSTVRKLFKQRLRWIYGFINNTIDYRDMLFNRKYGNFSFFTVPAGIISIFSVGFILGTTAYNLGSFLFSKILQWKTAGFGYFLSGITRFDPFFINTKSAFFVSLLLYALVVISVTLGKRMVEGRWAFPSSIFYYFFVFSIFGPFWLIKAVYNTLLSRSPSWR